MCLLRHEYMGNQTYRNTLGKKMYLKIRAYVNGFFRLFFVLFFKLDLYSQHHQNQYIGYQVRKEVALV